ncbi:MAG: TolC family protein [Bryobacteraceae bacterium]|nr:TolC family protein [Bryobacteraceae bacterium]
MTIFSSRSAQNLRAGLAVALCVIFPVSPVLGQEAAIGPVRPSASILFRPYETVDVPSVRLADSDRLHELIRDGKLYLTAQDAIALALENNIDLEIARYAPISAAWRVTRAEAGGALPGVPSAASQSTSVASGQGVLGSQAAAGVQGGSAGTVSRGNGNASISQIGPVTQTLDATIQETTTFSHLTSPQVNSSQSLTSALVQNQRTYTGSIQQGLLSGGSVSLSYSNHYLNENSPTDVLNPSVAPNLSFTIQHNLLQGFGAEVGGRTITISKINLQTSDVTFRGQVIAVVNNVLNAYYAVVAADEDLKAKTNAFDVATTFLGDTAKQIEIGSLAETERIKAESQVATTRQDLVVSETTLKQSEVTLKNLISRKGLADPLLAGAKIVALDRIVMPEKDDLPPVKELVAKALANRPDLIAEKANLTTSQISAKGTKNGVLPVLVPFAGTSEAGLAGTPRTPTSGADSYFVGGTGKALGQVFRHNFPSEYAGAYYQMTLANRQAQADQGIDQLQLRQTELSLQKDLNQAHVDVMNAIVALEQARARYEAAVLNRELAQQLLDSERKKFAIGASTPYNVILQQRDLATAQASQISALVSYNNARIALDQTVGQTLEANHIVIAEARTGKVARQSTVAPGQ